MTTIAYRDGVIAADTGLTLGSSRTICTVTKIARNSKGDLVGVCGGATFGGQFLTWFVNGEELSKRPSFEKDEDRTIVIRRNGEIEIHEVGGFYPIPKAPYFAIGAGRHEALGAMFVGADAETAVRAAMAHDPSTFGEVMVLHHPPYAERQPNGDSKIIR